ncbi:DsbA family protein [Nitrosopumilus piranensis]|uniref:Protein-disulfide isomerase-like protein n=1 Tax=Nitrosopumilus piranensis TaxID=1582439 RepID=A0A0C5BTJ9_9ARCH|nr:DsbA family protein [Nitrosopumilus piranensis]AJM91601.1 Protein-disulfide isomerase-like protein [Nitrosopumilus piranensis]
MSIVIIVLIAASFSLQNFDSVTTLENTPDIILTNVDYFERIPSDLPIVGISDAPVTIFAFNDYQCLSCKFWYEKEYPKISENLIKTNKANMVFLDAPTFGNDSILISQATFCADEQGKYSEYQKTLFSKQQEIDSWAKLQQLKDFAMDLNLNMEKFANCLDSGKYEKDVQANIDYTTSMGVEKIPLFKIINFEGKEFVLKGSIPSTLFEETVNRFQN